MRKYLTMLEVLGEGGDLQPLPWNPNHLLDGRVILIIDEPEARIWVWLGRGTTMVQRATALRQARYILRNGITVENTTVGSKCTEFIEVPGSLDTEVAEPLRRLLEEHPKSSQILIGVGGEEPAPAVDESFQKTIKVFEQAIIPEPLPRPVRVRRRLLSYEEQLACKVLFAATDVYGKATLRPISPNEFEVTTPRLHLLFQCQGDNIIFSLVRAAAPEDIESFSKAYGQQPQLAAYGQQLIDPNLIVSEEAQPPTTAQPAAQGQEAPPEEKVKEGTAQGQEPGADEEKEEQKEEPQNDHVLFP